MKSLKIALVALLLTGLFGTQAKASNKAVEGLIIGTAVGSIVGLIVGNEMNRNSYGRDQGYHQPVVYSPPPPRRYYSDRDHYRHDYRSHARICRDKVVLKKRHGRYYESIETVCRERR